MDKYISNQPFFNIGCLGSVSEGKSTLVEILTGIKTQTHSKEKVKNITIKQGYCNMKIWKEENKYITTNGDKKLDLKLKNYISFVDCPGHHSYILTALSSIYLMDGVVIVIAVDQPLSTKSQLLQHLIAIKIANIKKIIICLNKIDLVEKYTVLSIKNELDEILEKLDIKPFIIIPTSFNKNLGVDYIIESIMTLFNPEDKFNLFTNEENPIFQISRSFDINKPGTILYSNDILNNNIENNLFKLKGGVLGGSLIKGKLKIDDIIEIKPGNILNINNKMSCESIKSKIISIKTDKTDLEEIIPGGLIGILTDIDPYYCKNDSNLNSNLFGNLLGLINNLPNIYTELTLNINIINIFDFIWKPKLNDIVILQIGIASTNASISKINNNKILFKFNKPICITHNQHIIICYNINNILKIVADSYIN
jgi:translation initiation factor 2 subunit 3